MRHEFTERKTPVSVTLRCSCGWHREITRRQNALARAAKVRAAYAEHKREIEDQKREPNAHVAEPFRGIVNAFAAR